MRCTVTTVTASNKNGSGMVDGESLVLAKTMYTYFLLLFAIAAANENQPGTLDVRVFILVKIMHMLVL